APSYGCQIVSGSIRAGEVRGAQRRSAGHKKTSISQKSVNKTKFYGLKTNCEYDLLRFAIFAEDRRRFGNPSKLIALTLHYLCRR
ncbi:MAG: hypothetical protein ACI4V2_01005, partial [Alloprevotella sp.]